MRLILSGAVMLAQAGATATDHRLRLAAPAGPMASFATISGGSETLAWTFVRQSRPTIVPEPKHGFQANVGQSVATSAPEHSVSADRLALSSRMEDARVANVAFRLAVAGLPRCDRAVPQFGFVLQHLTQFNLADRPGVAAAFNLDRGPGIAAVVLGGPAAKAGLRAGDVLLALGDMPLPAEPATDTAFQAQIARIRADTVSDMIERTPVETKVTFLRDGAKHDVQAAPLPTCPSRVHLARSAQLNAFADGTHVFLTTGLLKKLKNDDELAFIVAHEMAHNILAHAAVIRSPVVKKGVGRMLGRSGGIVRATERDADELGGLLMMDAAFDPVNGATVLRRLGGPLNVAFLTAHGSASTRIAAMRALVGKAGAP